MSGCAGLRLAADPTTAAEVPAGPWFCEPAVVGGWDCTDDPAAVANPNPSRSLVSVLDAGRELEVTLAPAPVTAADAAMMAMEVADFETAETEAVAPAATAADLDDTSEQPASLLDLPPDFYTVQVLAMSSPTSLERFFDTLGIDSLAAAEVEVEGVLRYVLLLGVYEELAAARRAAANLPESLAGEEPWIRRLGGLQAAMRRANRRRED